MFKKIYIDNQESNYSVSDEGFVRNDKFNRILKGTLARNEYFSVQLSHNGKVKTYMIHRLVAEAFCEKPNELCTIVDHIDRNKHNNKATNLRWATSKENALNIERIARNSNRIKADLNKDWRIIPSMPGYSANSEGEVKNNKNDYLVKGSERNGYLRIDTSSKHRLIWEAFNGDIPEGFVIDHIDGNRKNNNLSNLRLVSQSENMKNAQERGHKGQVKVSQYDNEGNFIKSYDSIREASIAINGNECAIKDAANRFGKSAGYFWIRDDQNITIEEVLKKTTSGKPKSSYIGVTQYNKDGEKIAHYQSLGDAARAVSGSPSTIKRAADNKRIGKGYYWILDNQNITIDELIKL